MKKNLGYIIIVVIGVLSIFSLMVRNEKIDKNLSEEYNNTQVNA